MGDFKSQIAVKKFICNELTKRKAADYTWKDIESVKVGQNVRVFYAVGKSVHIINLSNSLVYLTEKDVLEAVNWIEFDLKK